MDGQEDEERAALTALRRIRDELASVESFPLDIDTRPDIEHECCPLVRLVSPAEHRRNDVRSLRSTLLAEYDAAAQVLRPRLLRMDVGWGNRYRTSWEHRSHKYPVLHDDGTVTVVDGCSRKLIGARDEMHAHTDQAVQVHLALSLFPSTCDGLRAALLCPYLCATCVPEASDLSGELLARMEAPAPDGRQREPGLRLGLAANGPVVLRSEIVTLQAVAAELGVTKGRVVQRLNSLGIERVYEGRSTRCLGVRRQDLVDKIGLFS